MATDEFTTSSSWGGRPVARTVVEVCHRGRAVLTGTITATKAAEGFARASFECLLQDDTGEICLYFPGRRRIPGLCPGTRCTIEGTARAEHARMVVWCPAYRIEPGERGCSGHEVG